MPCMVWDWYIYLHLVDLYKYKYKYTVRPIDTSWVVFHGKYPAGFFCSWLHLALTSQKSPSFSQTFNLVDVHPMETKITHFFPAKSRKIIDFQQTCARNCEKTCVWISYHYIPVGGFNPFEKYARQIGSFPPGIGVKIKNIWVATT